MFKISHGLLECPINFPNNAQDYAATRRRQYVFSIPAVPFWNKLPAEIINAWAVRSFKTQVDAN